MTDEEYIEKLACKGFSQGQVNQLLKIYLYTKDKTFNLDLSKLDVNTQDYKLRNFYQRLKNNEVSDIYLRLLNDGITLGINIDDYLDKNYDSKCLQILLSLENEGYNIDLLKNPNFKYEQLNILANAMKSGYDILYFSDPEINDYKMSIIYESLKKGIKLYDYFNINDFNNSQINLLSSILIYNKANPGNEIDIYKIAHSEFSHMKMLCLFKAMRDELDYSLLLDERSDKNLDAIYDLLLKNIDPSFVLDEKLSEKQLNTIVSILVNSEKDFDYHKILNSKYNCAIMQEFSTLVDDNKEKYLDYFLDKNFSFEKIHELIYMLDHNIDINKFINIDDFKEIHFKRRMIEIGHPEFVDLSYNEGIKKYLELNKSIPIETEMTNKVIKHEITCDCSDNQYFKTKDNNIIEIECYEDPDSFFRDDLCDLDDEDYKNDFVKENEIEIAKIIKNWVCITFDEVSETFATYDILEEVQIEDFIEDYMDDLIEDYTESEDIFYSDFINDTIEYLTENYTEIFSSIFEDVEDIAKYGGPSIDDFVLSATFQDYSEEHTLTMPISKIKKEYGDLSIESLKKAKSYLDALAEECQNIADGNAYGYTIYDKNGEVLDECWGFLGDDAIDQIEQNVGEFDYEIGNFENIDECFDFLEESMNKDEDIER